MRNDHLIIFLFLVLSSIPMGALIKSIIPIVYNSLYYLCDMLNSIISIIVSIQYDVYHTTISNEHTENTAVRKYVFDTLRHFFGVN